jgi:hypothetical protein
MLKPRLMRIHSLLYACKFVLSKFFQIWVFAPKMNQIFLLRFVEIKTRIISDFFLGCFLLLNERKSQTKK